ncbi:MAG: 3'-5' exonuclease [Thiohalocapsa sp.]|jgi:DNA polymerase-3 subunit epsilon|uniref:3'-5' exonuclease n=1 Tax=Thiohalocapsa sp. TaxID=2497641 RepID=UPI0025FADD7C|nr:3'-5' exonuclease [Thiohalocapsa sp.]MCG6941422.1 3'-5' exonuclease [Thiohalocapsa sp.]
MTRLTSALSAYRAAFTGTWPDATAPEQVRFVVLDCETTGLDPRRDRIVSIGAVAVSGGEIDLGDTFEALLRVLHNTAATLVHGITRDETREGVGEDEALAGLLDYLRDGVIVGHHIGHDLAMIDAALARHQAPGLLNRHLDTGLLALLLEADGAFAGQAPLDDLSLDGLCRRFDIAPYDRHTAPGDAFLTAQILLRLLRLAARNGRGTLDTLLERPKLEDA